jgi:hypothetical protein
MNPIADTWRYAEAASHSFPETPPLDKFPEFESAIYTAMSNDEDFAYIAEFNDRLIFCFQGTKDLKAWIGDFDAYPLQDPNPKKYLVYTNDPNRPGYIHCDFYKSWLKFKDPFQQYLQKFAQDKTKQSADRKDRLGEIWIDNKLPPVYYIGHSRGGALNQLAARDAAKNLGIPCSCFSFGAPRVGTKQYREEMDGLPINFTNIHHGSEFTQYLPPEWAGFRHAGKALQLEEPWWHVLFDKIKDHFYSTTTDSIARYSKSKGDNEGAHWMSDIVRKRVVN